MADQTFSVDCGFFDAVNNDRLYKADDMNKPYKRIVADGVFATPAGTPSTDLQVLSANDGMKIIVKNGNGLFASKWFENPSDISITVPENASLLPRRDSVIAQVDTRVSGRTGKIVYRTGTPSASPVPPPIGTIDGVIEYRIANISVAYGATYIGQDAIVDLRGSSECPWVTSLIQQVDTSTLYAQWDAAYRNFYNRELERVAAFVQQLTEELDVSMSLTTLKSTYTSTEEVSVVPINIAGYNRLTDALEVYINGLRAVEGSRYTVSTDSSTITLTPTITAQQRVDFIVFKGIAGANNATALEQLSQLSNTVSALSNTVDALDYEVEQLFDDTDALTDRVDTLTSDSGWINITLEGGATAYTTATRPAVRKYGNQVHLRGAFKGVTDAGEVICTLPTAYKPSVDHVFSTAAVSSGSISATAVMQVLASTGQVKLLAKSGTIGDSDMISIATNFILA